MNKYAPFFAALALISITVSSCTDVRPPKSNEEISLDDTLQVTNLEEELQQPTTPDDGFGEGIKYKSHNFPKKYEEKEVEEGPSHALDFRDRENDKFIRIAFSDGHSGTLVLRNGHYYNYTIREKTEVRFATKEDGLQRIWDDSRLLQDAGATIGEIIHAVKNKN